MKRYPLYGIISSVSLFIRHFLLPNPFKCFGDKVEIINWIAEIVIQAIAYIIVGLYYEKGSNPLLGSLYFLVTYIVIVFLLWLLSIFCFVWWWILLLIVCFIGVIIGVIWLKERLC